MPTNDFLPFATAGGANVLSQSDWAALAARLAGYTSGVANSQQVNKGLRQSAAMAAAIGQFINDFGGLDALDNGNISALEASFARSIQKGMNYAVATGTANAWIVAPSLAPLAYALGLPFEIIAPATNSSSTVTANISGLGAKSIKRSDGLDPQIGDLVTGTLYRTAYDGTNIRIAGQLPSQARAAAFQVSRVVFTALGSFSWTVPAGITRIAAKGWGTGGGGGGAASGTPGGAASGGGAGAYFSKIFAVSPGDVITGTIGTGGTVGTNAVDGGTGGNTTIVVAGTTYTIAGGLGGKSAGAGVAQNESAGGALPSGGDETSRPGGTSMIGSFSYNGSSSASVGGRGGSAPNGGQGGNGGPQNGAAGAAPGGGGGGGAATNVGNVTGGAGARGEVWIEY